MMKLKDWKEEDRPREKLVSRGAATLDDAELLAILLRTGTREETAVELSRNLLQSADNSLNQLATCSIEKLKALPGIGLTKAATIRALFELAYRIAAETPQKKDEICSPEAVYHLLSPHLRNLPHEECWLLLLNRANKIICKEKISTGGVNATIMDIRLIIKMAVEKLASGIIVVHNHPSGNPRPGEQDRIQTRALKNAAELFGISLIDHIVMGGKKYFSFAHEGCL